MLVGVMLDDAGLGARVTLSLSLSLSALAKPQPTPEGHLEKASQGREQQIRTDAKAKVRGIPKGDRARAQRSRQQAG